MVRYETQFCGFIAELVKQIKFYNSVSWAVKVKKLCFCVQLSKDSIEFGLGIKRKGE